MNVCKGSRAVNSGLMIGKASAEGCVDEIANARMAKKQRMRWSPWSGPLGPDGWTSKN